MNEIDMILIYHIRDNRSNYKDILPTILSTLKNKTKHKYIFLLSF